MLQKLRKYVVVSCKLIHPNVFVARILTHVLCMSTKSWRVNGHLTLRGAHIPTNLAAEGRKSGTPAPPDISQKLKRYAALGLREQIYKE